MRQHECSSVFHSLQIWARPRGQLHYGDRWHCTPEEDEDPDGWEGDAPALVPGKGNVPHRASSCTSCVEVSLDLRNRRKTAKDLLLFISCLFLLIFSCFVPAGVQSKKGGARAKQCCTAVQQALLVDSASLQKSLGLPPGTCTVFWSWCFIPSSAVPCPALTPWESGYPSARQSGPGGKCPDNPSFQANLSLPFCSSNMQADFFLFQFIKANCHFLSEFWIQHAKWLRLLLLIVFFPSVLSCKKALCLPLSSLPNYQLHVNSTYVWVVKCSFLVMGLSLYF